MAAELELSTEQIEYLIGYYNQHSAKHISFQEVIEGSLMANYIWALWGWIYGRIDLGSEYLFRFQDNLLTLQNQEL